MGRNVPPPRGANLGCRFLQARWSDGGASQEQQSAQTKQQPDPEIAKLAPAGQALPGLHGVAYHQDDPAERCQERQEQGDARIQGGGSCAGIRRPRVTVCSHQSQDAQQGITRLHHN